MLNRKKTRPDIVQAPVKITGKAITAFLAVILCIIATATHAQEFKQYSPGVEINTGVLDELSRQMDDGRESNSAPVKLRRPAPDPFDTNNKRQRPALTGRDIREYPDDRYEHIIMPRNSIQNKKNNAKIHNDDAFKILPKTKREAAIDNVPIPPRKKDKTAPRQTLAKAPLPSRKPLMALETAKEQRAKTIPVPQKRPAIKKASRSFVAQKRMRSHQEITNARVTDKNAPNLIAKAQKTMPSAPAGPVMAEPLSGTQTVQHKRKIIDAVQQIARANKEPEIDITAGGLQQQARMEKQPALDITAAPQKPQNIEPAAGNKNTPPAKVAAYSTNRGEVVRIPFPARESKIDNAIKAAINAHILPSLQSDPVRRIQLQSYASQKESRSNLNARRISLSRALAVRQYLIAMGIKARRIDIMPLGDKTDENQEDRIDFLIFSPNAS